jgi:hypothetical protein
MTRNMGYDLDFPNPRVAERIAQGFLQR